MLTNKMKYIICDENKAPMHSFEDYKTLSDVKDLDNVGVIIEEPYVIVDIDDPTEFEIVCKIIDDLHIKTRILKTSRGGHFWFKTILPIKNDVHKNTPLTVTVDIKCWGKKTMEIVKKNGEWREWIREDDEVDEIPYFLKPFSSTKHFYGLDDGDGRNDALFTTIIPLVKLGLNRDQVKELFYLVNQYMFASPLEYSEIDAMIDKNEVFAQPTFKFYDGHTFLHDVFADYMIETYRIKYYGKSLYIYDGRAYISDEDMIKAKMVEVIPNLKTNHIREAFENIRYKVLSKPSKINDEYVNVENGLLSVKDFRLIPHNPEIFTINKLNVFYDPTAKCDIVDKTIKSLCCDRQGLVNLIYEMMGYVLYPTCKFQKAFILLGNGSNGKSLFLDMIRNLYGEDNCSSLALEDLGDKFRQPEIVGKILNVGDDSGHGLLENTAIFKKLVTGDSMTFERKRQDPFKYVNTAKLIFAANALPPTTDKSDGFFRRCIIIPFDGVFRPGQENYDPALIYKVTTDKAKSYLLNLALTGLKKLLEDEYFDETDDTKMLIATYNAANNSVMLWLNDCKATHSSLSDAYVSYVKYCTTGGYKPYNMGKFKQEYLRYNGTTKKEV